MTARADARSSNTQRLTVNVQPEVALALDALSREQGRTLSEVVREALRAYLRKHGTRL